MGYSPHELTVVSAARLTPEDSCSLDLREGLIRLHLWFLRETSRLLGVRTVFVDYGSNPKIRTPTFAEGSWGTTIWSPADEWNEPMAKNIGLEAVETPLVAFTNADTWITFRTVRRTLEIIEKDAGDRPFILNGYRWEVPRLITRMALSGGQIDLNFTEGVSVPHAFPKLPIGEWQVCRTEDARSIGGFDERMRGYGWMDTDFHERARALVLMLGGVEILNRKIPVLHPHHYAKRPYSDNREIGRKTLLDFISTGETESLRWDSQTKKAVGVENDEVAAACGY